MRAWRQFETRLAAFQDWWPQWRYTPLAFVLAFACAIASQASCEAQRTLHIEEQRAIVDAAKRAGKTVVYEKGRDNGIGRVVDK